MKPLAIMPAYNEADVIFWTVSHLLDQGFRVHVIDNWSTDYTGDIALRLGATVTRWPASHSLEQVEWSGLLRRVEEIASVEDGWVMFNDADEIRDNGLRCSDFLAAFDYASEHGFNAYQFHCRTYWPVDDGYNGSQHLSDYFRHYLPNDVNSTLPHIKAWRQVPGIRVDLHSSGGHQAQFDARSVFPTPGLLKHYPVRSTAHGRRKIFQERNPRWSPEEKARRWHVQYSAIRPNSPILRAPEDLLYDPPITS